MASPPSMAMMAALSACLLTCVVIVGEGGRKGMRDIRDIVNITREYDKDVDGIMIKIRVSNKGCNATGIRDKPTLMTDYPKPPPLRTHIKTHTLGSLLSICLAISSSDGSPPAVTSDARVNVQYDSLLLVAADDMVGRATCLKDRSHRCVFLHRFVST